MWVQLLSYQQIPVQGEPKQFHPGDWVDIGKQLAMRLIASGEARLITRSAVGLIDSAAVVIVRNEAIAATVRGTIGAMVTLETRSGFELSAPKTLFCGLNESPRFELWPAGFSLLEKWDMAVPLLSYTQLARDCGSKQERAETQALVLDLRVPVYDPRLIFVRKSKATAEMLAAFERDVAKGKDQHLSFLRAFWNYKPALCALPTTWTDNGARGR